MFTREHKGTTFFTNEPKELEANWGRPDKFSQKQRQGRFFLLFIANFATMMQFESQYTATAQSVL